MSHIPHFFLASHQSFIDSNPNAHILLSCGFMFACVRVCVHTRTHVHVCVLVSGHMCVQRSEDSLEQSVLSFHLVGHSDQNQVSLLSSSFYAFRTHT